MAEIIIEGVFNREKIEKDKRQIMALLRMASRIPFKEDSLLEKGLVKIIALWIRHKIKYW